VNKLWGLILILSLGCDQIVPPVIRLVEYPEYLTSKERRKHQPVPSPLIDPYQRQVEEPAVAHNVEGE